MRQFRELGKIGGQADNMTETLGAQAQVKHLDLGLPQRAGISRVGLTVVRTPGLEVPKLIVPSRELVEPHIEVRGHMQKDVADIVVISNRTPAGVEVAEDGTLHGKKSPAGGLVTALTPLTHESRIVWFGNAGEAAYGRNTDEVNDALSEVSEGILLRGVPLTAEEDHANYVDSANGATWPGFHGLARYADYNKQMDVYPIAQRAQERFVDTVMESVDFSNNPTIFVQDYHLFGVGQGFRDRGVKGPIGFFLHIPWPNLEDWTKFHPDVREDILRKMTAYDVFGVHTKKDRGNLIDCIKHDLPEAEFETRGEDVFVLNDDKDNGTRTRTKLGAYLASIDPYEFYNQAQDDAVIAQREQIIAEYPDQSIGFDGGRLEYTKGFMQLLEGLDLALENYPDLRGTTRQILNTVPSRMHIGAYQRHAAGVSMGIHILNEKFRDKKTGWEPISWIPRNLIRPELLAHYGAASVAIIIPVFDGANLMWREYGEAGPANGVLVGGKFCGSAEQVPAILVDPNDPQAVAEAIHAAHTMPEPERLAHHLDLRRANQAHTVFDWGNLIVNDIKSVAAARV